MLARALIIGGGVALTMLFPRAASATTPEEHPRVDYTAFTLGQNEFRFSPLQFAYGVFDELTVGTYIPPWFLFPWLGVPVPSLFIKVRDWFYGPFAVSLRVNGTYLDATALSHKALSDKEAETKTSVFIVPIELAGSLKITDRITQSLELAYVRIWGTEKTDGETSIEGTAIVNTLTLTGLFELGLSRSFGINMLGRVMLYASPVVANGTFTAAGGEVHMDLGAQPEGPLRFSLIPGVSFHVKHFGIDAGVGYGHPWLPVVRVPYAGPPTIAPEFNAYFRF
jgi:hypothetical protein